MATKYVLLKDLKVGKLKKELEEGDVETGGKKAELQEKLRLALIEEGDDPDKFLFEVPGVVDINAVLGKMEETSRSLEAKNEEQIQENSKKMEENSRSLKESLKVQMKKTLKA